MALPRALIVDDSKTAQLRLKRMLERYSLQIDIAFSAEEALGYLSYRMPVVIFMDHHMEGMDGLAALKTIKANPNTAMVPVIMYTSEQGDVYVGQARALGALDILSKEIIKPAGLEKVLKTLNIEPIDKNAHNAAEEAQPTPPQPPQSIEREQHATDGTPKGHHPSGDATHDIPASEPLSSAPYTSLASDLNQVRGQVARLFEIHIADVRNEMKENTKFLTRRLSGEIERNNQKELTVDGIPLSVLNQEAEGERKKIAIVSNSLLVIMLLGLIFLGVEVVRLSSQLDTISQTQAALADSNRFKEEVIAKLAEGRSEALTQSQNIAIRRQETQQNILLMEALSWAMEVDLTFDFDEQPFSDTQIKHLYHLVYRLDDAGYRGNVDLDLNFGNFCLKQTDEGLWRIAPDNMPIEECQLVDKLNRDLTPENYVSLAYTNFEQGAAPISNGSIAVKLNSTEYDNPRQEYPPITSGLTAGEWNKVALSNNRVSINFSF